MWSSILFKNDMQFLKGRNTKKYNQISVLYIEQFQFIYWNPDQIFCHLDYTVASLEIPVQ